MAESRGIKHVTPLGVYLGIYAALLALLALTVAVARVNLGVWNFPLTLLIAGMKAALIMAFFMHLRESRASTVFFALMGLLWLTIFFALAFADFATR